MQNLFYKFGSFVKPLVTADIALGKLLIVLEKMMDTEFICPCDSNSNYFTNVLVAFASTIIFWVTLYIKRHQFKNLKERCDCNCFLRLAGVSLSLLLIVLLWLFVLFFNGHYYVCKMSDWNGTWTDNPANVPRKWCQPSADDKHFNDLKNKSVELFFHSQVWLMHLLLYSD